MMAYCHLHSINNSGVRLLCKGNRSPFFASINTRQIDREKKNIFRFSCSSYAKLLTYYNTYILSGILTRKRTNNEKKNIKKKKEQAISIITLYHKKLS